VLTMAVWNRLGAYSWRFSYPLELALVARLKEGPSIELTLCRSLPDPWRPLFRHLADALPPGNDP
jgi:hypothetical protein